jgi:beta-mannosidase
VVLQWFENGEVKESFEELFILQPGAQILPLKFAVPASPDEKNQSKTFLQYQAASESGEESSALWLPLPPAEMTLQDPCLTTSITEDETKFHIRVRSSDLALGVMLGLPDENIVFSDNFFDMVPGEIRDVSVSKSRHPRIQRNDICEKLRCFSVYDSYDG